MFTGEAKREVFAFARAGLHTGNRDLMDTAKQK